MNDIKKDSIVGVLKFFFGSKLVVYVVYYILTSDFSTCLSTLEYAPHCALRELHEAAKDATKSTKAIYAIPFFIFPNLDNIIKLKQY